MSFSISFVVPAFNESDHIEACLGSIESCSRRAELNYEIIVVDNGSTDKTATLANQFGARVSSIERSSVSHARNYGVTQSSYPLIAFIDGDVEITDEWIATLKRHYPDFIENPFFISGHQCIVPEHGSWIEQYWFKNLKDQLLGGANIITSRKVFDAVSGFDETLKTGEDYDFCTRCIDNRYHYFTDHGFKAIHLGFPHTFHDFLHREYWHGEGDFKSLQQFFSSQVAIISVVILMLFIIGILSGVFGFIGVAVVCLSIIILLNAVVTLKRFYSCGLKILWINFFLNLGYFGARIASLYRAIRNRHLRY